MPDERATSNDVESPPRQSIYCPVKTSDNRVYQGELIEGLREWVPVCEADQIVGGRPLRHRLALVATQDCDLEQEWKARQAGRESGVRCILLCPAFPADELRSKQEINSALWSHVRQNKVERYQYLAGLPSEQDHCSEGHAPLLVDFRSYFTVHVVEVYRQIRTENDPPVRRRFRLQTPWREHVQARFAAYLSRIGLPMDHFVADSQRLLPADQQSSE